MSRTMLITLIWVGLAGCPGLLAQPATGPATRATTGPTTRPPHVVTPPPGFVPVVVEGVRFLTEPTDEAAVRTALTGVPPATMPSTRPAAILERFTASRDQLKQRIMTDLALTDAALVDQFLDERVKRSLTLHRDISPPMIFLVTTEEKLKALVRGGWSDPRFYYNRAADKVEVNWNLNIPIDRPPDEALIPAIYLPEDSVEQRQKKIADSVRVMQQRFEEYKANHAADDCSNAFMDFLLSQTMPPVKNKLDREWIAAGICGVLTCRYVSTLTGQDTAAMIVQISSDRPDLPLRQALVDLVRPIDPSTMRPGAAPLYLVVYTRKAIRVCNDWIKQAGDAAIPKVLADIRATPPESGTALVEKIKQLTGVDLSKQVAAGQ